MMKLMSDYVFRSSKNTQQAACEAAKLVQPGRFSVQFLSILTDHLSYLQVT
jgi:hypothetical protein